MFLKSYVAAQKCTIERQCLNQVIFLKHPYLLEIHPKVLIDKDMMSGICFQNNPEQGVGVS